MGKAVLAYVPPEQFGPFYFLLLGLLMPLVWALRRHGKGTAGRVYGPDLMKKMVIEGQATGLRHFLYGTTPETLGITPYVSNDSSVIWRCGAAPDPTVAGGAAGLMMGAAYVAGTLAGPTLTQYLPSSCRQ